MNHSMLYDANFEDGPVQLGRYLSRITAPNPGPMTGGGTNTYLIGRRDKYIIVDPGPSIDSHIEAILRAVGGADNIGLILLTHMHADHSPAAVPLAELSGVPIYGRSPVNDDYQDNSCQLAEELLHDQRIIFDGLSVRAIHTPGHVNNHVCFLLEDEGILMTGDHIMQGSTVVIIPPHGDMKDYIDSLHLLKNYPLTGLAPGHGELISAPKKEIQGIIEHRLRRESKVVDRIEGLGEPVSLEQLTLTVYDDVDESLHPIAQLSLQAHLLKLEREQRVLHRNKLWHWLG
ncbi:putative polyketide biosynthesis zinc-dependent hydrolase BaeB [BD1-7 clade bacterium]|uniref:Putative polyketide biosynthesis zinc-dependent hydrolase BaeB n=1 Tax=BD1-7 clade bacterium TaxID=2029982 RepID=A0A5S9N2R4_9GAMM|nr:putative polyketide biosynthesis zinc-dependent hydrolase BaeB [BD1-7 clade bacterium]